MKKENCTGCMSCLYFCPTEAISVKEIENKFIREIDENKCIKCGKCQKLCHLNSSRTHCTYPVEAYIAQSRSFSYIKHGASGGIASTIYKYGINNEYLCVGVIYENGRFNYKVLNDEKDIKKTCGSKYVMSYLGALYKESNSIIASNKKVIFIGLPCHCATVKKIFNNIIVIDLVCNGVSSENKMWLDLNNHGVNCDNISDIKFREKNNQYGITIINKKGYVDKKIKKEDDDYMKCYVNGENVYESCRDCQYCASERVGDITLKDYVWKQGYSNVLINNDTGKNFWRNITKYVVKKEYSVEKVIQDDERMQKQSACDLLS